VPPKRRVPLGTFERPDLDLRVADAPPVGRAIPIQNAPLTTSPSEEIDPIWDQHGTKIYFASNGEDSNNDGRIDRVRADGTYHIWVMNPDGSNQRQITRDAGNQIEPALSPNGLRLAYASNESGDYDIYVLTLPSGPKVKLSLGTSEERHPTWAPGADKIAFTSDYQTGLPKIWSMNVDGTLPQMLSSNGPNEDRNPVWSPDGQVIAFESNGVDQNGDGKIDSAGGDANIWTMSYFGSDQRPVTAFVTPQGPVVDKDPIWSRDGSFLLFASDRKGPQGAWTSRGDFDIYRIAAGQRETASTSTAVQMTQLSPNEQQPLTGNEEHGSLFPEPAFRNPKVMYTSDQAGQKDIWLSSLQDVTDPRLEELPTVTPRISIPGDTVTITARVSDMESGVKAVYAQVRDPDDKVTDWLGQDHKVYWVAYDNTDPAVATDPGFPVWVEVDAHMVHATTYAYQIPPYVPYMDDGMEFPPSDGWIQLFDDGKHSDGAAGDGLYGATWKTPTNAPSDFYLDIIAYDNAGNWKIYDGVWGFTTQQFTANNKILLVMDYAHGQKFMQGERGGFRYNRRYFPTWFPVESYYTRNPAGMGPGAYNPAEYLPNVHNAAQWPGGVPYGPTTTAQDTLRRDNEMESYDLWRVICRGRLNPDVIAAYTPRKVEQPDPADPYGATVTKNAADRGVMWVSPYAGDLWVGDGTIVDADTQFKLVDFLDKGGRLLITGQDVAWALTRGGAASSPLLTRMGVEYVDDAPAWTIGAGNTGDERLILTGNSGDPLYDGPFGHAGSHGNTAELRMPVWYYPQFTASALGFPTLSIDISSTTARESGNHTDTDAAGNQYWIDSVKPIAPPAVETHTYNPNSSVSGRTDGFATVRNYDPQTDSYSVFCAFGLEGVCREYVADTTLHCHNLRHNFVHNAFCWMRTGTFFGQVRFTAGLGPAKGALVQVLQGNNIVGQAITGADGTYVIEGVPPGSYRLNAILPGFSFDHSKSNLVHGAGRAEENFMLSEAPPGSIAGRVTEADGITAVAGATVTATLQGLYKGEAVQKSVQTDQFGAYVISDLPTGLYDVTASAEGYVAQSYAGGLVTVNPGAQTGKVDFVMGGVPGGIVGVVTRASDGARVAGATVELRSGSNLVAQTTTDDQGRFAFNNINPGTYDITVSGGVGIVPTTVSVTVSANVQVTRNVVADTPPPALLAGTVRDSTGSPVSGATIQAIANGVVVKSVTSGAVQQQGAISYNYIFTALPAGSYELKASKPGLREATTRVVLQESQQLYGVDLTLESLHVFSSGLTMVSTPYDYST
ncbi:MAG: carboxypeptidase regulatory-like domain-containing protein, partial [Armatimonadota bacterium]|nr:carboxypeptidase regulatory-like domain-containing protein [Armatimonadota bacterium]